MFLPGPISGNSAINLGCVTRRTANRASAAFKCRDAFLQGGDCRVGQAGIDVADFLQVKQLGCVIRIAENIGCCLVDRHLTRACGWIRVERLRGFVVSQSLRSVGRSSVSPFEMRCCQV